MHTFIMKKDVVAEKEKGPVPLFRFFNMPKGTEKVKTIRAIFDLGRKKRYTVFVVRKRVTLFGNPFFHTLRRK